MITRQSINIQMILIKWSHNSSFQELLRQSLAENVILLIGRKFQHFQILLFGCLPYFLGWLLTALSTSVDYIYSARLLVGIGHAVVSTTVYTVEVTTKEFRGTFSVLESVLR